MREDSTPITGTIKLNEKVVEENKANNPQSVYDATESQVAAKGPVSFGIELLKKSLTIKDKELKQLKKQSEEIQKETGERPESQKVLIENQTKLKKETGGIFNKPKNEFGQTIRYMNRATKKAWKDSGLDPSKYRPSGTNAKGDLFYSMDDLDNAKKDFAINPDNIDPDTVTPPDTFIVENTTVKIDPEAFLNAYKSDSVGFKLNLKNITSDQDILKIINYISDHIKDKIDIARRGVLPDEVIQSLAKDLRIDADLFKRKIGGTLNAEQLLASRYLLVESAKEVRSLVDKMMAYEKSNKLFHSITEKGERLSADFANAFNKHSAIVMQIMGARAEAGRATRSFGLPVGGAAGIADPKVVRDLLEQVGGASNVFDLARAISKKDNEILNDLAKKSVVAQGSFWRVGWRSYYQSSLMWSPASMQRNLYGTTSLSLTKPLDTFYGATIGRALDEVYYKPLYGTKSQDKIYATEALIQMFYLIKTFPEATWLGLKAFYKNEPQFQKAFSDANIDPDRMGQNKWTKFDKDFNWYQSYKENFVTYGLEYLIKTLYSLPHRGSLLGDDLNKMLLYKMESSAQAYRQARQSYENGASKEQVLDGMGYQMADPDANLLADTIEQVNIGTLTNKLSTIEQKGDAILKMFGPLGALAVPFYKTIMNLAARTYERLPLGGAQALFLPKLEKLQSVPIIGQLQKNINAGGVARQRALGQLATGTTILTYCMSLANEGKLTGTLGGRDQAKEVQALGGKSPNSIKTEIPIRDENGNLVYEENGVDVKTKTVWQNLYGLDPIAKICTIGASLYEISPAVRDPNDEDWVDLFENAVLLSYAELFNTEWATNLGDLFEWMKASVGFSETRDEENAKQLERATQKLLVNTSRTFPAGQPWLPIPMPGIPLINQMGIYYDKDREKVKPMYDPSITDTLDQTFLYSWDKFTSKLPMFNKKVKPERNVFGEKITFAQPNAWNWVFPFWDSEENLTPLKKQIIDLNQSAGEVVFNMPSATVSNIKLNSDEYSDMMLFMNDIRIADKKGNRLTFKEKVHSIINDPTNQAQMKLNNYDSVIKKLRSSAANYKQAVFFKDNRFKELYPDTHVRILANKRKIVETSNVKRKEKKTEGAFILREIKKDIKEAANISIDVIGDKNDSK